MKIHLATYGTNIEIDALSVTDAVRSLAFWHSLPHVCPLCKSAIGFQYRTPEKEGKKFEYFDLFCHGETRHESTLGQYMEKERGLFYKGEKSWAVAYGEKSGDEPASPEPTPRSVNDTNTRPIDQSKTVLVEKAVGLAKKLMETGVEAEDISIQFLPDGIAKFSQLSEEQLNEAIPPMAEVLTARLKPATTKPAASPFE